MTYEEATLIPARRGEHAMTCAVNSGEARALTSVVHPKLAHGVYRNLKWAMIVLLASTITPWLR